MFRIVIEFNEKCYSLSESNDAIEERLDKPILGV